MTHIGEQEKKKKFEQFFILTFPKVKAFAWKILRSEEDAEDIAQDIFVKLWDNPEIWENKETWDSYIYTMTRNQIYNFLKHQSVELSYQEKLSQEDSPSFEFDIYDKLYATELQLLIKLTLDNMPEQRRKVFSMSRQNGMSNQEIADKLQLSIRTVERHIYLALQELKKVILIAFFFYFS
ncbi:MULTISPECIES: RNA polymerase sigma-70 factor [Bacteroides]|uniref:RNA polymerase sigma-70 factor n=1 Tax=Bacteroides TaxID=816 RepID=UPI001C377943|nr:MULTISPECIES: RNA polymerase sigma-70 factor [Bacteroides]MBV3831391.1 RNA polymerase sigma-70 factor [Bacteroides xylanisolvens]MBV3874436.1 RNA polymerase sigma-70 factor [Bacteroides xylanisolvens]MBV3879716.1 RNA polymerase sigma-70 factor [Bacteroides xylanisolvens]MBV3905660.1 RNA polymerase sigma-70 factor [Bacteroides xylanisolvens]MBV3911170.1 RNA polymerase sigma-70 factor [Bacteroides xylanisolvens]